MAAIDTLVDFYFASLSPMPRPVVITINYPDADPLSQRGALRAISPEEIRCAMLARGVARGAPIEDLKSMALSCPLDHHTVRRPCHA